MMYLVIIGLSHPAYVWWYCRKRTEEIKRSFTYDTHIKATSPIFSDTVISNEDQGLEVVGAKLRSPYEMVIVDNTSYGNNSL